MVELNKAMVERPYPKRFYKDVSVSDDRAILLDGRAVKTPLKAKLVLPTKALADAVAQEWQDQVAVINPALMPLTKLANTAIDRVAVERAHVAGEVVSYAMNDLVCYRAEEPAELVALQAKHWDPALRWAKEALGAELRATKGIMHVSQPEAVREALGRHLAKLDDHTLCAVHNTATLLGSTILALMLAAGVQPADQIWTASHVDEDFQISQWGEDFEAVERRARRKIEFDAAARFLKLLG